MWRKRTEPVRETGPVVTEQVPPPEPGEMEEDDLLRRVSDTSWRILVVGVVAALLLWAATYTRVVTLPIVLAVFLTALLMPAAKWLRRRGLGRGPSTTITFLGAMIVFGGVVTLIVQPAINGVGGLLDSLNQAVATLQRLAASLGLDEQVVNQLVRSAQAELQRNSAQLVSGAWAGAVAVGEVLIGLVLTLVLTVYFVHSGDRLMEWVCELFPQQSRRALRVGGRVTYGVMGRYVRGVAIVGFIDAVGIGLFLVFLIDIQLAIPLIVLTFIGAFLPVVGAFLTGLIAALVAFIDAGWVIALVVIGATVLVQQLESHIFAPRIYGKALELPSAIVLLAIAVGSIVGGIAGAFLATPVAAVIAALLRNRPFAAAEREAAEARRIATGGIVATAPPGPEPAPPSPAAPVAPQEGGTA
ncbi:Predicted PurR-regulated permease PerM [Marinactinospora thermotolerans DSM 45154]|uniref:Predicted PurR-regulated permease PerM n=1 Tax=Marinactinospora thermotolerans DSM 45154 TaxID=1122192 RepID=A0A1T4S7X2_9ACTN|nr:Predicted PurR-regulated permease PerM [Marinactinospora thermotolerans DSM 45154]